MKKLCLLSLVIMTSILIMGCSSKDNSVLVMKDNKYMILQEKDKFNTNKVYEDANPFASANEKNKDDEYYSIVNYDNKYGIINDKNQFLLEPKYDYISKLYNDFFIVKENDKYGYVNKNFKVVQKPVYLDAKEFMDGVAFVQFPNNKWGCISNDMKVLLEGKYDEIFPVVNSYARTELNDKWGFINKKCEVIIEPKYDYVNNFYSKFTKVVLNKKVGYINEKGEEIVKPDFEFGQRFGY
ncbi:KWG Leptospira repeat protein [Arcobacter nitrofigilis DSM 7299]|uniref:KWG Leptospira repeat protein n=1 Tax=Arcobacter nitrofigilis (strain ATCC 33309 / DSM 7299 / CCUG 15893 / LMG 7604 / NCTC 12251 / CI) TaxID=572480 RepID=D5V6A9_ARCNC|nr:WG repeat-containing protein [Arcobacter nitrofigilis]ADG94179.1 KWG Leptospira repeat protein [Arcobacter nitrofigilis DSM 7299]